MDMLPVALLKGTIFLTQKLGRIFSKLGLKKKKKAHFVEMKTEISY